MTKDRWQEIKTQIKQTFGFDDEYSQELDPGQAEVVEFTGPEGRMMVKFVTRPKLLDKKTMYSNRPGSDIKVDYVFSEDEFVSHLEVYIWSDDQADWRKLDSQSLF